LGEDGRITDSSSPDSFTPTDDAHSRQIVAPRFFWTSWKYFLALGLLGYIVFANWDPPNTRGLKEVWQAHVVNRQPINGNALLVGFLLFSSSMVLSVYRWHILMRAQDLPITRSSAFRIGLLGFFFNTFLPGSVGGDIVKAAAVAREQSRRAAAVATVVMDRIIGLWSLVSFVALLGGLFWGFGMLDGPKAGPAQAIVLAALCIVGVSVAFWVLMGLVVRKDTGRVGAKLRRIPKVGGLAAECWHVVGMYRSRQASIAWAIGLSWLGDVALVIAFYCCGLTLWDGHPSNTLPTVVDYFLIVPAGNIFAAIPLFPGGAGISEAGFGGLFVLFGSAASNGILAALVSRFVTWVSGLLAFLVSQCMQSDQQPTHSSSAAPVGATTIHQVEHATIDGIA
jgi:glycosyltransferase 2 family protein